MVDILRELEKTDAKNTVSIHIFVTQFYQKFDLRTILLVRHLNVININLKKILEKLYN